MRISPINNVLSISRSSSAKNQHPNFQAAKSNLKTTSTVVKTGVFASIVAFFKEIKELFTGDDWTDMPPSEMDMEMDIKTGRDMIP